MPEVKRVVLKRTRKGGKVIVYRHAARGGLFVSAVEPFTRAEKPSEAVRRLAAAKHLI